MSKFYKLLKELNAIEPPLQNIETNVIYQQFLKNTQGMDTKDVELPDIVEPWFAQSPKVGNTYWFEYHCYESCDSADAELWYRSHQQVKIKRKLGVEEGIPVYDIGYMYEVVFKDGFEAPVGYDELYDDPKYFTRPHPPIK